MQALPFFRWGLSDDLVELSSSSMGTGDGGGRADNRAFLHSLYCLDALCWP